MNLLILQEIEANLQTSQETVALGKALGRLMMSRDFQLVILKGYLEKEAVRLVHLKATPSMQGEAEQKGILSQLDSVGCLQQYLFGIQASVEVALKVIETAESTREDLLAEG